MKDEIVLKRSDIGKWSLFKRVGLDTSVPNCLLGHVFHHFHMSLTDAVGGVNYPPQLEFLLKPNTTIHNPLTHHVITYTNDRGDLDGAVAMLRNHGLNIKVI